jgi:subtilisin family serine protease
MYDMLGQEGILNVCAAPNQGISVDEQGDMPTTCTSEYMIAVTNVDVTDVLLGNAGYGIESIDLAAPGHGTLTTATDNAYKQFPGTSAAAPHVTGVIGLMYSTPCAAFLNGIKTNPSGVAEKVRDIIFETAEPNNSLEGLIVTGGRLNAAAAMEATVTEVKILGISPNPPVGETFVYFESKSDTALTQVLVYTVTGALVQEYALSAEEFAQGFVRISTSGFPVGMYLVTIRNRKHKDTVRLFVAR